MRNLWLLDRLLILVVAILAVAALVGLIKFDMRRTAASLPDGGGAIRPALTNIKRMWVGNDLRLALVANPARSSRSVRRVTLDGLARLCGRGVKTRLLALYNVDAATPDRTRAFLRRVEREFERF